MLNSNKEQLLTKLDVLIYNSTELSDYVLYNHLDIVNVFLDTLSKLKHYNVFYYTVNDEKNSLIGLLDNSIYHLIELIDYVLNQPIHEINELLNILEQLKQFNKVT